MRFLHIADLHVGRKLLGTHSLVDDQQHILEQVIHMAKSANAVLIAGDVYDRSQPSQEAIRMVSSFLSALAALQKPTFLISGNHDSAEQIAYCHQVLKGSGIYVSPAFDGRVEPHTLFDAHGPVTLWLLPYIKPYLVRQLLDDESIHTYNDAVFAVLSKLPINKAARNILLMHQFVAGSETSQSEELSVGGLDSINPGMLEVFDYVALGHLHKPQRIHRDHIRYSGSPLKYSLSEENHIKGALMITLEEKGSVGFELLPFEPLHDMRTIRGTLNDLVTRGDSEDYVYAELSDDVPPFDPYGALKSKYPNCIGFTFAGSQDDPLREKEAWEQFDDSKTTMDHFITFYMKQHGGEAPGSAHVLLLKKAIEEAEEYHAAP